MYQFERVLEPTEQILWTGQPKLEPWLADRVSLSVVIGIFGWILVGIPLVIRLFEPANVADFSAPILVVVGLVCQVPIVVVLILSINNHQKYAYALTTKRLLFQKPGRRGSFDIASIPFAEVKDMQLNQGISDFLFGGGTKSVFFSTEDSYIDRGRKYGIEYRPKRFEYVANAEEVLRLYESQQEQPGTNTGAPKPVSMPHNSTVASAVFLPVSMQPAPVDLASLPSTMAAILKPQEQVLWLGQPKRLPFLLHYFVLHVVLLIFLSASIWSFLSNPELFIQNLDDDQIKVLITYTFLLIAPLVYRLMVYHRVFYVVTDRRVLVQSGAVGIDIESFEREQLTDVATKGGFLDTVFGGGSATVVLETFKRRDSSKQSLWWRGNELQHIDNAGLVQELLRPTSAIVADRAEASFVPLAKRE